MGWPSTFENIRERIAEALDQVHRDLPEDLSVASDKQRIAIDRSLGALAVVVAEARSCLDIATDPSLDLALLLSQARNETLEQHLRCAEYESSCMRLMSTLNAERTRRQAAEEQIKTLRVELNRANKRLDQAMKEDPAAVYASYMKGADRKVRQDDQR